MPSEFIQAFEIRPTSCVSVIGSGGKSTLITKLVQQAQHLIWPSIITTTTHIRLPFLKAGELVLEQQSPDWELQWEAYYNSILDIFTPPTPPPPTTRRIKDAPHIFFPITSANKISIPQHYLGQTGKLQEWTSTNVCPTAIVISHKTSENKAVGVDCQWIDTKIGTLLILVEADGSRQLPWKIPAVWEPVLPQKTTHTIIVLGAQILGKPLLSSWVHRIELLYQEPLRPSTPVINIDLVAQVLAYPTFYRSKIPIKSQVAVYIAGCQEQSKIADWQPLVHELRQYGLHWPIFAGEINNNDSWIVKLSG